MQLKLIAIFESLTKPTKYLNTFKFTVLTVMLCAVFTLQAQCNLQETIVICDMTQIDGDGDGNFDGVINLYDEYTNLTGNTIQQGTWFDPGFNFALNGTTGDLFLWDLDHASESETDYQFLLSNTDCGSDIALTINVVLGPFSGIAVPANTTNGANVEICDIGADPCGSSAEFDLFQALQSIPSAHTNGVWAYNGNSPNFIGIDGSIFQADIPYQPGMPLVDEETFELIYTVPGITPCSPSVQTMVRVSVIREVFSGAANNLNICESEIVNGDLGVIDLRDDDYLVNEDIEGIWLNEEDTTGQLSGPGDSVVDFNVVYNDLIQSNPKFGCQTFEFSYMVESRSTVCDSKTSTVSFTVFEELRPFSQTLPVPEFCVNDESLSILNLYDYLTFTTENGVLFDYPNNSCTNWELVSGPSNLGLISNNGTTLCQPSPTYSSLGTIDLSNVTNADAGVYTFRYTVLPEYNCEVFNDEIINNAPDGCSSTSDESHPCQMETAEVTIVINPFNYAGEDTGVLEFCEADLTSPIDLIPLLITNGVNDPIYVGPLGTWTDLDSGNTINDPFTIPEIDDQQNFNFVYTTTTPEGCIDSANLSFILYEEYQSGTDATVEVCNDDDIFNLFNFLGSDVNTNGAWIGPNGFTASTNNVNFDPATFESGDYTYSVPDNGNGTDIFCTGNQATVTVTVFQNANAGSDMLATVCKSDLQLDLLNILDPVADSGGVFQDINNTNALNGSILDVTGLDEGDYDFQYDVQGNNLCSVSSAILTITVVDVEVAQVQNQTFCITDAATISDIQILNNVFDYNWYETSTSTNALPESTLLVNGEDYFIAALDANGCESVRSVVTITVLPFSDSACDDCEINDGISNNGDNENEELDLCNLPVVFPNFEIKVFNRYGTLVYKGNRNTELFNGTSNVSLTIGNTLPSGTYFYVFNPNDNTTSPFQGSVYLSR